MLRNCQLSDKIVTSIAQLPKQVTDGVNRVVTRVEGSLQLGPASKARRLRSFDPEADDLKQKNIQSLCHNIWLSDKLGGYRDNKRLASVVIVRLTFWLWH